MKALCLLPVTADALIRQCAMLLPNWGFELRDPKTIASPIDVQYCLDGFDLVYLPLTLPNFGSLKLAEQGHARNAPTALCLISRSDMVNSPAAGELFDFASSVPDVQAIERLAFEPSSARIARRLPEQRVQLCVEAILNGASCFRVGMDGRHSWENSRPATLRDYRVASRFSPANYRTIMATDLASRCLTVGHEVSEDQIATVHAQQSLVIQKLDELLSRTPSLDVARRIESRERMAEVEEFIDALRTWESRVAEVGKRALIKAALIASGAELFGLERESVEELLRFVSEKKQ